MKNVILLLVGFVVGILLCIVVPLAIFAAGTINFGATTKPGWLERTLAPWALDQSRETRAPRENDPYTNAPAVLVTGLDYYRANCVMCHGAPEVDTWDLAKGLNPSAPHLQSHGTQSFSDGELFWTVKQGVRMTGMPAFKPTHSDEQIWIIVAFVRHLPSLSADEKAALRAAREAVTHLPVEAK
ncbi:MAG: cytochrome c [Candidatus Omnitrophica bacterium]|nr:cytochrome c [Candidatus Omnitrophota bacterium]